MSYCPLCNKTNDNVRKQNKEQTFVGCQVYTSCVHFAQFADKYIRTQFLPAKLFRNSFSLISPFSLVLRRLFCHRLWDELQSLTLFSIFHSHYYCYGRLLLCCGRANRVCVSSRSKREKSISFGNGKPVLNVCDLFPSLSQSVSQPDYYCYYYSLLHCCRCRCSPIGNDCL